jgi:hypothetical protein
MIRERALKVVLVVVGLIFFGLVYPLTMFVRQEPGLAMMLSLYVTLGIFLLLAARNPSRNRSLIAFTAWSSFAHATLMRCRHFAAIAAYLPMPAGADRPDSTSLSGIVKQVEDGTRPGRATVWPGCGYGGLGVQEPHAIYYGALWPTLHVVLDMRVTIPPPPVVHSAESFYTKYQTCVMRHLPIMVVCRVSYVLPLRLLLL